MILRVLLSVIFLMFLHATADAQCVMFDKPDELFAANNVVFRGKVLKKESTGARGDHVIVEIATFQVAESWKGDPGREVRVGADRPWEVGKEYLVFAGGNPLSTSLLCRGTELVERTRRKLDWLADVTAISDPEAYAVYASLLPHEWIVTAAHATTLIFQQETQTNRTCMPSGPPMEKEWKPVLDHFRAENATRRLLQPGFQLGFLYRVVPAAEIQRSFNETKKDDRMFGWTGFYNRFPDSGGFMVASAVGFDSTKRRAMVYLAHSCGGLCGGGMHHLLEKVDGAWREAKPEGLMNCAWAS